MSESITDHFVKYPSIEQYRSIIKQVQFLARFTGELDSNDKPILDPFVKLPTLTFYGSVKLHGTNAGVSLFEGHDDLVFQSRNNILSLESDNAGFCRFGQEREEHFKSLINQIKDRLPGGSGSKVITIFGEFCGGNIQKGVGISGLDKMFIIFGCKVDNTWVSIDRVFAPQGNNIYNISEAMGMAPKYEITIDFNRPEDYQNKLVELTEAVEAECPVAKAFGVNNGVGEGIVWESFYEGEILRFKVKGEKHSSSKVKKLASICPEKLNSINEFIEYAITENRMSQAIEQVFTLNSKEPDIKGLGSFIKWVMSDVNKEESDTLAESNLLMKDISKAGATKARLWFIKSYS